MEAAGTRRVSFIIVLSIAQGPGQVRVVWKAVEVLIVVSGCERALHILGKCIKGCTIRCRGEKTGREGVGE